MRGSVPAKRKACMQDNYSTETVNGLDKYTATQHSESVPASWLYEMLNTATHPAAHNLPSQPMSPDLQRTFAVY